MARQQFSFSNNRDLIGAVAQYCTEGRTGTLMAVTGSNRFLRLIMARGDIIHIEYRLKKGADAIPLIPEIEHGTFEFMEGRVAPHVASPLPPTSEILAQLGANSATTVSNAPGNSVPKPRMTPQQQGPVANGNRQEAYRVIEQELIEVLGPMASLVWSEHLERAGGPNTSADLSVLVNSVCSEIDSPKRSAKFQERVWARLR